MDIQNEIGDCFKKEIAIPGLPKELFCKKAESWAEKKFKGAHIRSFQPRIRTQPFEIVIKEAFINIVYGSTPDMTLFSAKMTITDEKAVIVFSDIIQHIEGIGFFKIYEKNRCKKLAEGLNELLAEMKKEIEPALPKPPIAAIKSMQMQNKASAENAEEADEAAEVISA